MRGLGPEAEEAEEQEGSQRGAGPLSSVRGRLEAEASSEEGCLEEAGMTSMAEREWEDGCEQRLSLFSGSSLQHALQ